MLLTRWYMKIFSEFWLIPNRKSGKSNHLIDKPAERCVGLLVPGAVVEFCADPSQKLGQDRIHQLHLELATQCSAQQVYQLEDWISWSSY